MRLKIKLLKDPYSYWKHFLWPESPLDLHESWGFAFALLKWCIFYFVMNMASAYKAEPTSGAKLVKGVKEELKKCPRPETPASETQEYQRPQRIWFKNSKVPHLWFYKGIENANKIGECVYSLTFVYFSSVATCL